MRRLFVFVACLVSLSAVASVPTPDRARPRRPSSSDCCDVDLDMCPRPAPPRSLRVQVLEVIAREGATARACLDARAPAATVRFEVGHDGQAQGVTVRDRVPDDVRRCLQKAVRGLRFPQALAGHRAPLSFRFERQPAAELERGQHPTDTGARGVR